MAVLKADLNSKLSSSVTNLAKDVQTREHKTRQYVDALREDTVELVKEQEQ